ncbi:LiaI-LiaF-like domain-containing protein [Bacillus sp. 03113]|uniref:LiaI-LiaF-like domain-containing protein n=1 Tax=Bacillus sp. 03113 TaxID=2578211 RepID=UPI001143BD4A|nr:DUF5668 domain-containing protein [Bacillus sp. 03113]
MKTQRVFAGIILLGFGAYIFLQQSTFTMLQPYFTWPTLLIIVGIAFLFQGYGSKNADSILPGVILTGFGLHFHLVNRISIWPDQIGMFIFIIALGFLLRSQKSGSGSFQGVLFLILSIILLFYDDIINRLTFLKNSIIDVKYFVPGFCFLAGIYLLFIKRK